MSNSNLQTFSLSSQAGITRWSNPPKVWRQRLSKTPTRLQNRVSFVISIHSRWRSFWPSLCAKSELSQEILLCIRLGYISKTAWLPCRFSSHILTSLAKVVFIKWYSMCWREVTRLVSFPRSFQNRHTIRVKVNGELTYNFIFVLLLFHIFHFCVHVEKS